MNSAPPSNASPEALQSLLDDPSPTVRSALLAHFAALGPVAQAYLEGVARGSNRVLATCARAYLRDLKFTDPVGEFRAFIRSLHYELESGVLLLSRTVLPDVDVGESCDRLDAIAARCRELIVEPSSMREKCRVLNRVLFHEHGFRGNIDHYTDPLNSFLPEVLRRHKGIPISLSTVYLLVAGRLGLELEPVGLPRHFIVGCYVDEAPFFIDPFEQGRFRSPGDVFAMLRSSQLDATAADLAPTPVREVLCRYCRNLAKHYAAAEDLARANLFASFVRDFEATYERETRS